MYTLVLCKNKFEFLIKYFIVILDFHIILLYQRKQFRLLPENTSNSQRFNLYRSNHRELSMKKVFLKVSQHSYENTYAEISFLIAGWSPATLLKKRLRHMCFLMNFEKFLRTTTCRAPLDDLLLFVITQKKVL